MAETQLSPRREPAGEVPILPAQFTEDLTKIYDGRIRELHNYADDLNHQGKVPLNVEKYRRIEGLYLSREVIDELGGRYVPSVGFTLKPFRGLGRENSRRKVFFGDLDILGDEQAASLPVAVKPYQPGAFHRCIHEMGMYQYMNNIGLPTLRVLGVLAVNQGKTPRAYVLTHERRGITSLDNVEWKKLSIPERWTRMRPTIETMAILHSKMVFHGDLEFKNVVHGETERSLYIVDPEDSVSLRDVVTPYEDRTDERHEVVRKVSAEFEAVRRSVRDFIAPEPDVGQPDAASLDEKEEFEDMLEHVFSPYYLAIMRTDSPYQTILRSAFSTVIEQKRQYAYKTAAH
jgi:hypothetical protein